MFSLADYCVYDVQYGKRMGIDPAWDIAGFTDAESMVGKRVPSGEISVWAGVELDTLNDSLTWPWCPSGEFRKLAKPTGATFNQFVSLWRATPRKIVSFARKWGRLGVDEKGRFLAGRAQPMEGRTFREPLQAWRYFSRRACAALSIAANLRDGRPGAPSEWAALSSLTSVISVAACKDLGRYPTALQIVADRDLGVIAETSVGEQGIFLTAEITLWKIGRASCRERG